MLLTVLMRLMSSMLLSLLMPSALPFFNVATIVDAHEDVDVVITVSVMKNIDVFDIFDLVNVINVVNIVDSYNTANFLMSSPLLMMLRMLMLSTPSES